eukprot:g2395.t1
MLKFKGSQDFRYRLICSTLSSKAIQIDEIRTDSTPSGLTESETSLLRILESISNGCVIEINPTGTSLFYKPGLLIGGTVKLKCETGRNVSYYLEVFCILSLFGKQSLHLTLEGITNDETDVSVDVLKSVTLPTLARFCGIESGLELKIHRRGAPPNGGGLVEMNIPIVREIPSIHWTDEGMIKRIRGLAYSLKVSPQFTNKMVHGARELLNNYLADVHIFTDAVQGKSSGNSPGYGLHLVGETTTGCLISSEASVWEGANPEDVGRLASAALLEEIKRGGVVDSVHQAPVLLLCALGPEMLSEVRLGPLTSQAIAMLRTIRDFFGIEFSFRSEREHGTIFVSCVGIGIKNISRRVT